MITDYKLLHNEFHSTVTKCYAFQFFKMLNTELPYDSAILLLGIPKRNENVCPQCTLMFVAALFVIAKKWK